MSDTKPMPDDPDRTVATPATADPPADDRTATGPALADPTPGEPVWAAEPAPATADPAAHPAAHPTANPAAGYPAGPGRLRAAGGGLRRSRAGVPLLVGAVALVLGCCLGAGVVAVGAAVIGDGHRGDDRSRISHERGGDRGDRGGPPGRGDDRKRIRPGQDGLRKQPSPAATPSAPATTPPAPSAS